MIARMFIVLSFLTVMLTGCSITNESPVAAQSKFQTAEGIHETFLTALEHSDRQVALDVLSDDMPYKATQLEQFMTRMDRELHPSATDTTDGNTGGNLAGVRFIPFIEQGERIKVYSQWTFDRRTVCHETTLVKTPKGWRVISWGDDPDGCGPRPTPKGR